MTKIIKNLLTLADIENLPRFRLQQCALIDLLSHCKYTLLNIYPEANIQIHSCSTLSKIEVDPELIEVAFMNLIDNAIKYSKQEATVVVTVEEKPGAITIAIQDQGIGIPETDLNISLTVSIP